jgi:hypothetical protein
MLFSSITRSSSPFARAIATFMTCQPTRYANQTTCNIYRRCTFATSSPKRPSSKNAASGETQTDGQNVVLHAEQTLEGSASCLAVLREIRLEALNVSPFAVAWNACSESPIALRSRSTLVSLRRSDSAEAVCLCIVHGAPLTRTEKSAAEVVS